MLKYKTMTADEIIRKFDLKPLPEEGGYFRETFRDQKCISSEALAHHSGDRAYSTCIYYLITPEEFSGLHAVKSVEIFHFYAGDPIRMVQIDKAGNTSDVILGNDLSAGHTPQVVVAENTWQGTKLVAGGDWALLGCTVAPGFDYRDFINGTFDELSQRYPQHTELIREYTHN